MIAAARPNHKDTGHFVPGVIYLPARNKLYRFSSHGVSVIRIWPNPRAWAREGRDPWRSVNPLIDLRVTEDAHPIGEDPGRALPVRAACAALPPTVRDDVLAASFHQRQWKGLQLAALGKDGASGLQRDVPLLAAALADANTVRQAFGRPEVCQPWRSARALLRPGPGWSTWRRIAGWLGLPDDKAFIGLLRRVGALRPVGDAPPWELADFLDLAQAWSAEIARKRLLHSEPPTPRQARLLGLLTEGQVPQLLSATLYEQARQEVFATTLHTMCTDIIAIRRCLSITDPAPTLGALDGIERLRGRLIRALDKTMGGMGSFPAPPLPSTPYIVAIPDERSLIETGHRMQHCLGRGDWALLCRARRGFAYQVRGHGYHGEEEATAWIVPITGAPGRFELEQLQGHGNRPPNEDCVALVRGWLNRHNEVVVARQRGLRLPSGLEDWPPTHPDWTGGACTDAIHHLLKVREGLGQGRWNRPAAPAAELLR
jgi:hypothetical protein